MSFIKEGMDNMMQKLDFQLVGMLVVFGCLIFLALILTVSGKIAAHFNNRKKGAAAAAKAASAQAAPQTASASPVAQTGLSPDIIAAISAAVHTVLGGTNHRIIDIKQSATSPYSISGRTEIYASHRIQTIRRS